MTNTIRTLHHAAADTSLKVAELLIDRGAGIDPRDLLGRNPNRLGGAWRSSGDDGLPESVQSQCLDPRIAQDRLRKCCRQSRNWQGKDSEGITPLWWLPTMK